MGMDVVGQSPARMSLIQMTSGDALEVQFNPTEFEEGFEVVFAELTVPGNSHKPQQFVNTGNHEFDLELFFDAGPGPDALKRMDFAKRFLLSLGYPLRSGGFPRVLLIWPNVVSMVTVLKSVRIRNTVFNLEGTAVQYFAKVKFSEILDVKIFSEDVLLRGTRRSGVTSPLFKEP